MKNVFYDRHGDLHEVWSVTGLAIGACVFFVLVALVFSATLSVIDAGNCARLDSYESQHDYRWGLFTGCMVQTEAGYWVDSDNPTLLELEQGE